MSNPVYDALADRFIDPPKPSLAQVPKDRPEGAHAAAWAKIAGRTSCRRFSDQPVDEHLLNTLCALALSSPSKSDLQQRDLVIVDDPKIRQQICDRIPGGDWVVQSPVLIVFCGNNRRHRQIMAWRNQAFVNDHLDAFFNAAVDAGIALSAFICAAEAAGLGCCPLSVIRNEAALVSELLGLPDQVFPVAGLALGWPSGSTAISKRLPLAATVHRNRFSDAEIKQQITEYDKWRSASQPFASQRDPARFGNDPAYGWSEDKARQYADPERADFGAFIRGKGFGLG